MLSHTNVGAHKRPLGLQCTYVKIQIPQFRHVPAHHSVAVAENDLSQVEWEEHIYKQDLVRPYQPLLLCLQMQSAAAAYRTTKCCRAQTQHSTHNGVCAAVNNASGLSGQPCVHNARVWRGRLSLFFNCWQAKHAPKPVYEFEFAL